MLSLYPELRDATIGWAHPELRSSLDIINHLCSLLKSNDMRWESAIDLMEARHHQFLDHFIRDWTLQEGVAWAPPLLHPDICTLLTQELECLEAQGMPFTPNQAEGEDYQIPEVVVRDKMPRNLEALQDFARGAIFPLLMLIWGRTPTLFNSIQFARYTPEGTANGNWHHDEDSNYTVVISLSPGSYEGGGTDLMVPGGMGQKLHVPPLPQGHGLIFNGHHTLHQGSPVFSGSRDLLVYWMTSGREEC